MKLLIFLLPFVYAIKKSCRTCIWIRDIPPNLNKCEFYNIPIKDKNFTCASHKLKNIDW